MDAEFRTTFQLGSVEPRTYYVQEGGRLACYSYAIHRDEHGLITEVTPKKKISEMWLE